MNKNKIALSGVMGSGKDYLSRYLIQELGYQRLSFGDIVKELAEKLYPKCTFVDNEKLKDSEIVYVNPNTHIQYTRRDIYVYMNKLKRINPNVFLDIFISKHKDIINDPNKKIVVTDLRFSIESDVYYATPELEYLQSKDFNIIYIESNKTSVNMGANIAEDFYHIIESEANYKFFNDYNGYTKWVKFLNRDYFKNRVKKQGDKKNEKFDNDKVCNFNAYC